ncbi:MAG: hypothetical protein WCA77_00065, partial [Thermoplasmata archaeon]
AVEATIGSGTGSPPYGPACLFNGAGGSTCISGPGPTWSFNLTYDTPGGYSATVAVADSAGANSSVPIPVNIVASPLLSNITSNRSTTYVDDSVQLSSNITGGFAPYFVEWNGSWVSDPLSAGPVSSAGLLTVSFAPPTIGTVTVLLTVTDALGTRTTITLDLNVVAGPAVRLGFAGNVSQLEGSAGQGVDVSWIALDENGHPVSTFAAALTLVLGSAPAETGLIVALATSGPIAPTTGMAYNISASAWVDGYLNLTITADRAGAYVFEVPGSVQPPGGNFSVRVTANTAELATFGKPSASFDLHGINSSLYSISDRYGNPLTTGTVTVRTVVSGIATESSVPIEFGNDSSFVWVNYTIPQVAGGTLYVLGPNNVTLLGPVPMQSVSPTTSKLTGTGYDIVTAVALLLVVSAAALGLATWSWSHRRPSTSAPAIVPVLSPEAQMRRWAEGRFQLLNLALDQGTFTIAEVERLWDGKPPLPSEIDEWVAAMVSEGLLTADVGPDGRTRFAPTDLAREPETEARLAVDIDPAALDAALARREGDASEKDS